MKKLPILSTLLLLICLSIPKTLQAIYDPVSRPNNIFGIHILFPSELEKAAGLVNSSGGDWGHVTIPVRYDDREIEKWQGFMDEARERHVVPIVRLSTNPHFNDTSVWRKPNDFDVIDFANFLDSLVWPTKNRYVLLFNEVNRFDEWGGNMPSPEEYADAISFAADIFKKRNSDFFIIAGGLDNAAPNDGLRFINNITFLQRMGNYDPEVFKKIDGFASHSYPNPNFSESPSYSRTDGISAYKFELNVVEKFAGRKLPVFITETGWNAEVLPQSVIASYLKTSMTKIWGKDQQVVAVTPFILEAGAGPFSKFTFFNGNSLTDYGNAYKDIPKTRGEPLIVSIDTPFKTTEIYENKKEDNILINFTSIPDINLTSNLLKIFFRTLLVLEK